MVLTRNARAAVEELRSRHQHVHHSLSAVADRRAGTVLINDQIPIFSEMPHGGDGATGFGKDMSTYSLQEYPQIKHVAVDRTPPARQPWHRTIFG